MGRKEGEWRGAGSMSGCKEEEGRREEEGWEESKRKARGQSEGTDRPAGRCSPVLDDEIHQGQGGLGGDSDGQVQGQLSRGLNAHPHL